VKFLRPLLLIVFLFSSYLSSDAQNHPSYVDLTTYLKYIEAKQDIIFSFSNEEVKYLSVNFRNDFNSTEEFIDFLRVNTPFEYKIQDENNVLIIPENSRNKVCLNILNSITGEKIQNAFVRVQNFIFHSDENGGFILPLQSSENDIIIFGEDFVTKKYAINRKEEKDCYTLKIKSFYQSLNEVFLTSLLTSGIQKTAAGYLEIDYNEFGLLPGMVEPDVLQSIQALPGIMSPKESVSYLNVRGGTHDQNLFLWDGIKMYSTSHFFGMISAFNPYMTDNVKLIKNGTSAKFGDGVSSLIDIKTSNTIDDKLEISVGINFINADAIMKIPVTKKSSIEVSSRFSVNSLWESPTYESYFDKIFQNTEVTNFENSISGQNNDFNFVDSNFNYKYQLSDKDFLKLNFLYAADQFDLNRFDAENNFVNIRNSSLDQTNLATGLYYERNWSNSTKSELQFYASDYELDAVNTNVVNDQTLEQKNQVNEIGFKLNFFSQLGKSLSLENGYQFNETGILNSERIDNPFLFNEIRNSIITNSFYSQLNFQTKDDRLNLQFGGRLNHYSKFNKIIIEPRFSLSYELIDDFFIEILTEEKSQVTSQIVDLQEDFLGVENRRWVLSNPDSRPIIESQQISAGFNFVKPSWFFNVDVYYKNVVGITSQGQGFQNQFEFSNVHGSYEVKGFDILINKNFKLFSGWLSYSLSENLYTFEELEPSTFHNNLDIRHVISTGLNYEKNGLKVSAGLNWHSGVPVTLIAENQNQLPENIVFEDPNAARLIDYFRLDISSTYNFKLYKNIRSVVGVSFLNILNSHNVYNQFYNINSDQNIQSFRQNGIGFTPNLLFRVNF